ncbi:hypothetical protein YPPY76_4310, partial [Yersinia pestis PY-76]
MVHPRHQA